MATAALGAVIGLAVGGISGSRASAAETPSRETAGAMAEAIRNAPVNQWFTLPQRTTGATYTYAQLVYVPTRGQLLQWGNADRNDVVAFDATTGQWASDYPSDANVRGVYDKGKFFPSGAPCPDDIVNSVCWDGKRQRLVYATDRFMAAYDPAARKWARMPCKTVLYGEEIAEGLPFRGMGICHDPVNDEIVMFPHWSSQGGVKNLDRVEVDGRVSGHLGTFRYSHADGTWRRVGDTFGSEEVKAARKETLAQLKKLSDALDAAWAIRRRPGLHDAAGIAAGLRSAAAGLGKIASPAAARSGLAKAIEHVAKSAAAAEKKDWAGTLVAGREALWAVDAVFDTALRVEPPPRCSAPMVYDEGTKSIVMFGGHSGLIRTDLEDRAQSEAGSMALNDTWIYDCATRQWRQVAVERRPPPIRQPKLMYDPGSKRVLLAEIDWRPWSPKRGHKARLWSLDTARGEWTLALEHPWVDEVAGYTGTSLTFYGDIGIDPVRRLLVFSQPRGKGKDSWQETRIMRLDLNAAKAAPAPVWTPPPPIVPHTVPPDDPAAKAALQGLPANTWVDPKPSRDTARRDYGNLGYDPVRDWVVYFGGGHSTYQANNVATYQAGANGWTTSAGDHNDFVPPTGWGGVAMGFNGGNWAHHQRNQYQGLDGRMYTAIGACGPGGNARFPVWQHSDIRPGWNWFYDMDRGGIWRRTKVARTDLGDFKDLPTFCRAQLADPAGKIYGLGDTVKVLFTYDIYDNTLKLTKMKDQPSPKVLMVGEPSHFCLLPDQGRIFYFNEAGGKDQESRTWFYDIKTNTWTDSKPKRNPPAGRMVVALYLQKHKAIYGTFGQDQWVYSLERNTWAQLPNQGTKPGFGGHYVQMVYSPGYDVLVLASPTRIMRPDLNKVEWDAEEVPDKKTESAAGK